MTEKVRKAEKELLLASLVDEDGIIIQKKSTDYLQALTEALLDFLNPIKQPTAPLVVFALEQVATAIKGTVPGSEKVLSGLRDYLSAEFLAVRGSEEFKREEEQ